MIVGPWNHLEASAGDLIADAGLGTLDELKLRWFDHYVKGIADPALDTAIAPLTYYEQGTGAWRTSRRWVGTDRRAASYRLSGSSTTGGAAGGLTTGTPADGTADIYPVPVAGLCTRSASQWTAGLPGMFIPSNPCDTNNALNDNTGVVFRTEPVTTPVQFQGPINARLYVSTVGGDGMLSVAVEDEAPDGTVSRLSGGWQVISHRALDASRSRYLDGKLIQPFHPFTQAAQQPLAAGAVAPVDVEIFPTGASIQPGHRLRIAVQSFDVPHLLPTLPDLLGTLTVITLHNSTAYPSELTLPVVGSAAATSASVAPATSRTSVSVRRPARHHATRARVRVIALSEGRATPAGGRVRVWVDGRLLTTRTLSAGATTVRIPARFARHGTHRVRVTYLGASGVRPSTARATWQVA